MLNCILSKDWCQILSTFEQSSGSSRMSSIFAPCVQIVESGLALAGLPCCRLGVVGRCRVTRQLVCEWRFWIKFGVKKDVLHLYPLRINRWLRFGFGGSTVLLGSSGDQVSFNTTVGGSWCCSFKGHSKNGIASIVLMLFTLFPYTTLFRSRKSVV